MDFDELLKECHDELIMILDWHRIEQIPLKKQELDRIEKLSKKIKLFINL